ncbi:MAG: exodeoxyribonuclease V subunit beta [Xanthomonadales bacterium]|nr:exodeoxyribonuclease V subunit beta [Xanthomonadales bacterium]
MKPFDLSQAPLDGWNLIEANAGTGKTYCMTRLLLRLMLEQGHHAEEVLLVTFTRAATAELKTRVLKVLRLAAAALAGQPGDDRTINQLCADYVDDATARERINRALRTFDQVAVYTIHGFCQQLLTEFAGVTGFDLDAELIEDDSVVLSALAGEQWQLLMESQSTEFAAFLQAGGRERLGGYARDVRSMLEKPYATLIDRGDTADLPGLEGQFRSAWQQLCHQWPRQGAEFLGGLLTHDGLSQQRYKPAQLRRQASRVDRLVIDPWIKSDLMEDAARLGRSALEQGTNQGFAPPDHRLMDVIEAFVVASRSLREAYATQERRLPMLLRDRVAEALDRWKQRESRMLYRDLVERLQASLEGPMGERMAQGVEQRFRAALIDEFQDTDPLQFSIFRRLFRNQPVFLVGDPKQALYGFRGADVFAYLQARQDVDRCYALNTDWRAHPGVLAGINRLFIGADCPFALEAIDFRPSEPSERPQEQLLVDGEPDGPLLFWTLPVQPAHPSRISAAESTAAQIQRLIDSGSRGRARLTGADGSVRPLVAGDIVVLVRKHTEAALVARALNQLGISCVQPGTEDVFRSSEAADLERVLHGVCYPERSGRMAGALATALLGGTAELAERLATDTDEADHRTEQFRQLRGTWEQQGIAALINRLVLDFGIASRLLRRVDGRRRLTNIYHLLDLMEQQFEPGRPLGEQLDWLHSRRQVTEYQGEESLLRLESEEDLVRILTIHKSKGLEFPVVFCPYLWDANPKFESPGSYLEHHAHDGLSIVFNGSESDLAAHLQESVSENLRLLYVALTRTRNRAYLAWTVTRGTGYAALRMLLDNAGRDWQGGLDPFRSKKSLDAALDKTAEQLVQSGLCSMTRPRAGEPRSEQRQFGEFQAPPGVNPPAWSIHSYSSLAEQNVVGGDDSIRDVDRLFGEDDASDAETDRAIFKLPAGSRTGLMVHGIFERLSSFDPEDSELMLLVEQALTRFQMPLSHAPALAAQIRICLTAPLDGSDPGIRLDHVPRSDWVAEMEFHLSLRGAARPDLWRLLDRDTTDQGRLDGFLRGFIDLIFRLDNRFYIVDYKTNLLGNDPSAYTPEQLKLAIRSHDYELQYLLYTLALHRHLSNTVDGYRYDSHFGGVYYLFIRGMQSGSAATGVHYALPSEEIIGRLDRLFSGFKSNNFN